MKKLSIFFAALMISAMAMAVTYTKVTSAPIDWSGEYLLVYEQSKDSAFVFTTEADAKENYVYAEIASNAITGTFNTLVIAKMEGGYSVKVNGGTNNGKYLAGQADKNKMFFDEDATAATIEYTDNSAIITSNTSVMRFNSASDAHWFRFFRSSSYTKQKPVQLYKLKNLTEPTLVDSIGFVNDGKDTIEVGDYYYMSKIYKIFPDTATDQRVEYNIISGSEYISVNPNGIVKGLAVGDAQVLITAIDSLNEGLKVTATYDIHVKEAVYITCADVNAVIKGDILKLNPVTAVYVNGSYIYVKDESGSSLVYFKTNGIQAGDYISGFMGEVVSYNGLPEFKPGNGDWTTVPGKAPEIPEAYAVPTADEVNQVLVWRGVTDIDGEFTSSSISNLTGNYNGEEILFRNNFKLGCSFDGSKKYDITGAVATYTSKETTTIQVYFISAEEQITTGLEAVKAAPAVKKMMLDDKMVIIRDGKMFNALGAEL